MKSSARVEIGWSLIADRIILFSGSITDTWTDFAHTASSEISGFETVTFGADAGSPEYHERVFGLFNKLNPQSEGTGIGLCIVKRIIEVHGGRIWIESEAAKGATFYFTLPPSPDQPTTA